MRHVRRVKDRTLQFRIPEVRTLQACTPQVRTGLDVITFVIATYPTASRVGLTESGFIITVAMWKLLIRRVRVFG